MAQDTQRRIRVGIDTGGTFTDVVAFDEDTGELVTTKTPSTPGNPADGFIAGIEKILGVLGASGQDITAVCHGTTVATNKLLEGKVERLGFVTTEGYEFMLEIARQAVPDGYGNSYFWVKPPRIVAADHVRTDRRPDGLRGQRDPAVRRGLRSPRPALVPRARHHDDRRLPPALLRERRARARDARGAAPRAPRGRRLDQLGGAARVPRVRAVDDHARRRRGQAERQPLRHATSTRASTASPAGARSPSTS